ncbi:oxidoreductase [Rhodobacter veldkampii DSM 11550]|uniref:Oxidoreductase n=1 Tax=Phaeovulum veldkampii DSM 11550 TaxID=1185920 RepID=A0A2T4JJV4_9RHOB|nr:SDR family oxidoreductase [Phaeovulum veldkampii]MBK5946085.1 oxidoreductase [Phaeovulum veldkampii DSM 11550]NCU19343.1 SDR family oxidoreductase [Candidatus Falkowbacteria bacterium]PTE18184.1 oxidoreductase [Phaeovulum veldkampii DSM 11550]TDQ63515.1 7-alpha-hydroxysteroid dehydrogenase [Phaeovulum veldkampii DSM 11550]
MTLSISGKTAIVTGAANGIGLAIARHFVDRGANVMFADIDEAKLAAEVDDAAHDGRQRHFAGDLCQKLTAQNLLSATIDAFERIDILVNASRSVARADPLSIDDDVISDMLRQNLMASLRLSQMTARRMISQAEKDGRTGQPIGSIINISSIAARLAQPELMAYSIACAGLDQATRSLAVALAPQGIRVNGVAFGSLMSASMQAALKDHPGWRDEITANTPMGRIAAPVELAEAVQFLAADGSGFVTGQILTVDGGRTLIDPVNVPIF